MIGDFEDMPGDYIITALTGLKRVLGRVSRVADMLGSVVYFGLVCVVFRGAELLLFPFWCLEKLIGEPDEQD